MSKHLKGLNILEVLKVQTSRRFRLLQGLNTFAPVPFGMARWPRGRQAQASIAGTSDVSTFFAPVCVAPTGEEGLQVRATGRDSPA